MKIDRERLVDLLVAKTSMERHEVEAQLEQLIERIVSATKRGKALEIKGFGTFYFDSDHELKFDPSRSLSTEISYKYAGMQPVELLPERDTSITLEDPLDGQEDGDAEAWASADTDGADLPSELEKSQEAEGTEDATSLAAAAGSAGDESTDGRTDTDHAGTGTPSRDEAEPQLPGHAEESVSDRAGDDEAAPTGVPLQRSSKTEEPEVSSSEDRKKQASAADKEDLYASREPAMPLLPEKRQGSGAIIWVIILILLVGAALAAYFYFAGEEEYSAQQEPVGTEFSTEGSQGEGSGDVSLSAAGDQALGLVNADGPEDGLPSDPASGYSESSSASAAAQAANGNSPAGMRDPPLYGLRGEVIPRANDGYSIVLHSFDEESKTEEVVENLINEGYRTIVGSRTVAGRTMWRVSVGQFETLQDAQNAATELPPPYNTQNFIHRIQLNN